ncbi:YgdI/YgdR family lipoprotein, partial [Klebsiella pneumoniae]|nr:YgdI/YgdR family lipoprotein [Klebsiella pneumoniae]
GRVGDLAAAGCSSNQEIKTTDDRTIVTDGKPKVDSDTGLVSYKMPIQAEPNRSTVTKLPT